MKKLFALIALIFTLGMMVDFRPEETPPDVPIETVDQELNQKLAALPVYRASHAYRAVIRYDSQPSFADTMLFKIEQGQIIPTKVKKQLTSNQRLDKEFDPGRCSQL